MTVKASTLRNRSQTARQQQRSSLRDSSTQGVLLESAGIDLGVHLPVYLCTNPFEILRPQAPPQVLTKERTISSLERRDRRIRDAREMRRRRDARHERRRANAAQILDEQLSRDIDRTLREADIQHLLPNPARPPTPTGLTSSQPLPILSTPPRLPLLHFGGLDLMDDFPPLTPVSNTPLFTTPISSSPMLCPLPSWCPPLPALTSNLKLGEFPMFFDLSRLPEAVEIPRAQRNGHEIQLWRPQPSLLPRKVSRYFPQTPEPKATPSPVRCKLRESDKDSEDASQVEEIVFKPRSKQKETVTGSEASAANLWHILSPLEDATREMNNDPYFDSFTYRPVEETHKPAYEIHDHSLETIGAPVELDSTKIPFVRVNSLTGHANESGSDLRNEHDADVTVFDTALATPVREFVFGSNEFVVDQEYEQPTPNEPPSLPDRSARVDVLVCQSESPLIDTPIATPTEVALSPSEALYTSEQALCDVEAAAFPLPDEDMVDVAAYLSVDHDDNCWCDVCEQEWPELLDFGSRTSDDEWIDYA